jgi:hypothetical protein
MSQVHISKLIYSCYVAGIRAEWPWWDSLHGYWRELPNYNPQGVQSSELGVSHALAAAALFAAELDEADHVAGELGYGDDSGGEDDVVDHSGEAAMLDDVGVALRIPEYTANYN